MQPDTTPADLRIHPLEPALIGPNGLFARIVKPLAIALDELVFGPSYSELLDAIAEEGHRQN